MNRSLLSDLAAFAVVARTRNFRRAAAELNVSPSALSHCQRGLEEKLGIRLLNRTTRSVTPTEAGEQLLLRLQPALRDIEDALDEINQFRDSPIGHLRLNVPQECARLIIAPLMASYIKTNPNMQLEVISDNALVDIVAEGFDAGVRFGESIDRDMVAIPISKPLRMTVVASTDYLAQHGIPQTPDELSQHTGILYRYENGSIWTWEFIKNQETISIRVNAPIITNDLALMIRAAEDGIGLAYIFELQVEEQLKTGKLVKVLEDWCPPIPSLYLYYPSRRQMPAGLRAFIKNIQDLNHN